MGVKISKAVKKVEQSIAPPDQYLLSALGNVLKVKSYSSDDVYTVNRAEKTCTCPSFQKSQYCKHLELVYVYEDKNWYPKPHPSYSQALSALVKAIRVRRVEDAVYWMMYLHATGESGSNFRLVRRLLIGSAEDGVSLPVMENVSQNYAKLMKEKYHPLYLAAEIVRICKIPSWWLPDSGGPEYIRQAMVGWRQSLYVQTVPSREEGYAMYRKAVKAQDFVQASLALEVLVKNTEVKRTEIAQLVHEVAQEIGHAQAIRAIKLHLRHAQNLSNDYNFIGQAAYWSCGGSFKQADDIEGVIVGEVRELLDKATERWKNPKNIEGWCCDGHHCSGTDRRFAGMVQDLNAMCLAAKHYGTIDVSAKWLDSFRSVEGSHVFAG